MTESGPFEGLSVFPERAIDFHDFQEQIQSSRNGRHVWKSAPHSDVKQRVPT